MDSFGPRVNFELRHAEEPNVWTRCEQKARKPTVLECCGNDMLNTVLLFVVVFYAHAPREQHGRNREYLPGSPIVAITYL